MKNKVYNLLRYKISFSEISKKLNISKFKVAGIVNELEKEKKIEIIRNKEENRYIKL